MKKENTGWKILIFLLGAIMIAIFFVLFRISLSGRLFGVEYTLNDDGESYTLTDYGALNIEKTFVIPSSYNGKPVTEIGRRAFKECAWLKNVIIPNSITYIGYEAFSFCYRLESVTIPDSVTSIEYDAFSMCGSLTSVYVTSLEKICTLDLNAEFKNFYLNGNLITDLIIPDSVTSIGNYAFQFCDELASLKIPGSVESIGNYAFRDCDNLTSVIISDSVKSIGNYAFYDCDKLTIYYESDETEWNSIDFGDTQKEEELKRFYYSETAPTEDGNFWHYNANGEIEVWP